MLFVIITSNLVAIVAWSLFARRLERLRISQAIVMVCCGMVVSLLIGGVGATDHFETQVGEKIVEVILAILLFVDAVDVRGGLLGGQRGPVLRLVLIALPLSLAATFAAGLLLLPGLSASVLFVIACVVTPTDFTGLSHLLRTSRIPHRTRVVLNVESGYNDGVVSPLFLAALAIAMGPDDAMAAARALELALPASGIALAAGLAVGGAVGLVMRWSLGRGMVTARSLRMGVAIIPVLAYLVASWLQGNGFVAAFVAGIAYRAARGMGRGGEESLPAAEIGLADDLGGLAAMTMWFSLGVWAPTVLASALSWQLVLFVVLTLTVLRMVPVALSLVGCRGVPWRQRLTIGAVGPRGTASIVFGLLAFNQLSGTAAPAALATTTAVVLGSLLVHGVLPTIAGAFAGARDRGKSSPRGKMVPLNSRMWMQP